MPRKNAMCRKIIDRHLAEQQLIEMTAFYSWLRFTLTEIAFHGCQPCRQYANHEPAISFGFRRLMII